MFEGGRVDVVGVVGLVAAAKQCCKAGCVGFACQEEKVLLGSFVLFFVVLVS